MTDLRMEIAVAGERQCQQRLEEHLLLGGQTAVFAAADFRHIVSKADAQVAQCHKQHRQQHVLPKRLAVIVHNQRRNDCRARDDQTAHRRRTLLFLVCFRCKLIDILTEFELMQQRQQQFAQHNTDGKRNQQGYHHPLHDLQSSDLFAQFSLAISSSASRQ